MASWREEKDAFFGKSVKLELIDIDTFPFQRNPGQSVYTDILYVMHDTRYMMRAMHDTLYPLPVNRALLAAGAEKIPSDNKMLKSMWEKDSNKKEKSTSLIIWAVKIWPISE